MNIVLSGKKRSGKDTVADYLVTKGYNKCALADYLKLGLSESSNGLLTLDDFNGKGKLDRETIIMSGLTAYDIFSNALVYFGIQADIEFVKDDPRWSIRKLMQVFGTDIVVDLVDELFWVKNIKCVEPYVVTDIRFEHELNYFKSKGDRVIRIERNTIDSDTHRSEQLSLEVDIVNNGTLSELYEKVELCLNKLSN